MKQILRDLISELRGEIKTVVGTVDPSLVEKLSDTEKEHKQFHKDIRAKVEAYIKKLEEEHRPVYKAQKESIKETWNEIYDAAGIPSDERDKEYMIDHETRELSRVDVPTKLKN